MAITSYPFDNQDTTETQYSWLFRELQDSGVADSIGGTGFQPYGDSTGMTVKLKSGYAVIRGFAISSDAVFTVTLPAADSTPRVDRVVLRVDPTANSITPTYIKGVAGAGVPAALTQTDTGIYDLPIALVSVAASAPNIGPLDVADDRRFLGGRNGVWTTATRPASPRKFQMGFNNDVALPEWYDGAQWTRKLAAHWGSGTAFPTSTLVQIGDTFVRTDVGGGTMFRKTANGWRLGEDFQVADLTARNAIPADVQYAGFRVWVASQGQNHIYDAANSRWTGTQPIQYRGTNWVGQAISGGSVWKDQWSATIPDPGFIYTVRGWLRQEIRMTNGIGRLQYQVTDGTNGALGYDYFDQWMTNNSVWNFFHISYGLNANAINHYTGSRQLKGQALTGGTDTASATSFQFANSIEVVPVGTTTSAALPA